MIYVTLFLTFARICVCTLGGGSATIPFLMELPDRFGWVTAQQLAGIIAVGESAPGPGGVNMVIYIGYEAAGIGGVFSAVLGLCLPSFIIMTLAATYLHRYREHPLMKAFFHGLRPAVVASILSAVLGLMSLMLLRDHHLYWRAVAVYGAGLAVTHLPQLKRVHLIWWILAAGVLGAVFQF